MTIHPHPAVGDIAVAFRTASPDDAPTIAALLSAHRDEGHLLPRDVDEIKTRAPRFVVAECDGTIKACAELVPLSTRIAEVRSLVVSPELRRHGVATRLIAELEVRARAQGFQSLLALAHDPRFFMRHDFSIVPHEWLPEKISRDCAGCALFRQCGQHAMLLPLGAGRRTGTIGTPRQPAAAVA